MFHPIDKDEKKLSIAIGIEVLKAQVMRDCNLKIVMMKF